MTSVLQGCWEHTCVSGTCAGRPPPQAGAGLGRFLACVPGVAVAGERRLSRTARGSRSIPPKWISVPPPRQVKPDPTPLLTSRHNVFQNDEFDVFSRDSVDLSRVHKGRR